MQARMDTALPSLAPLSPHASRADVVSEALRRAILGGALPSGERLVERDIAARLNVSKTPVREALRDLARRGLVTAHPYRGTVVRDVDPDMARHIYEVRALLEP